MKILIATPAYGGMVSIAYMNSLMATLDHLNGLKHETAVMTLGNESLITRARNRCATFALKGGFDKLMFIDADIAWIPEMVEKLLNANKDIIGGTYPVKAFPATINLNTIEDGIVEGFIKEVQHVPTGFMLIDKGVLIHMLKIRPAYETFERHSGQKNSFIDFFPCGVTGDGRYLSEDWAFCEIAREAGFKIFFHTECVTTHIGSHDYRLGQRLIEPVS